MNNQGTPKTLRGAIENGLKQFAVEKFSTRAEPIEMHVRDFLSQKLCAAMLDVGGNPVLEAEIRKLAERIGVPIGGRITKILCQGCFAAPPAKDFVICDKCLEEAAQMCIGV